MSELSTLPDKLQHLLKAAIETQDLKKWEMKHGASGEIVFQLVFDEKQKNPQISEVSKVHSGSTIEAVTAQKISEPSRGASMCFASDSKTDKGTSKLGCVADYEDYCCHHMTRAAWIYFSGGAMAGETKEHNKDAFKNILVWPKHLVDGSRTSLDCTIHTTGQTASMPIGIAPSAFHGWATPQGERATIHAAKDAGIVYISSLFSNTALEEIVQNEPNALLWQHMQIVRGGSFNVDMIHRAEKAGVSAIVLTIDRPTRTRWWMTGWDSPEHLKFANFGTDQVAHMSHSCIDATWEDVTWFCQQTSLPVILKGVLTPEDVRMAIQVGAKGVIVSNHGGRVLDSLPATIEVLRNVVHAAEGKLEVFFDGGIRSGMDVFKALAYGARMVFIGRAAIWGLAHSGQAGLSHVIDILKEELLSIMIMAGTPTLSDITMDRIYSG